MKCFLPLSAALALAALALPAQAFNCDSATDTASENECADTAFKAADKELNRIWPQVKQWAEQNDADNETSADYVKTLMAAQRAWQAYRDAYCLEAGLPMHGGSGEAFLIGSCRAIVTEDRVKALKELLPE